MSLPDGPKLPALLQTLSLIADPTGFLETCSQRYGDPFTLRVLGVNSPPVIFFSHPDAVQAIFTTLSSRFELGKVTHIFRPLTGDRSLIMQDGSRHQKQRQLLMPALHGEGLYRCGSLISHISRTTQPHGSLVSVQDWMLEISLETILRVVFGLQPGARYQELKSRLQRLLERINSPLYSLQFFLPPLQQNWGAWSPWGQFLQLRQQIDDLLYAEIRERRDQGNQGTDILSLLIAARDEAGTPMDDTELRDQLMTLLLLGHETTASGLTWAFYWLYRHPDVLERLHQELDALGPDPDPLTLAQQPYLTAVCKEALRVYPIALIAQPRRVREPIELAGYQFEPGAVLVPCVYLAHRRPETYPEPLQFRPERFLSSKSAYEYFPFGGGNRSCIGMALALFEMKLVLATLLRTYEFEPAAGFQPLRRPARRGITFVPPRSVQLRIIGLRMAANDEAVLAHP
ncbi:MAG: cytochrome P450 [Synechococcales cyanobacterium C42_A2020_086]|jgi:cytochrome P450|nr:cytochrome P450 [Synechococcales cyanobacterium C42_A2020_086]